MPPKLPRLPIPRLPHSPIEDLRRIMKDGRTQIERAADDIRSVAGELRGGITSSTEAKRETPAPTTPPSQEVLNLAPEEIATPVAKGTACIPCSRDHLSTSSSALSEGIRFAREKGVKDHEVIRRIRIALDELNIMERIDLAPEEIVKLKGAEKELADWTLKQSRDLRHDITTIKDVESMERAAAKTSAITEEFMSRLWAIPEDECETCEEVRESIRQFIEKRKRERAG